MFEKLKMIKKTQLEAKKIINDALRQVDLINKGLLQKSMTVNEESYRVEVAQAKKKADAMLESSSKGFEKDIEMILSLAEHQVEEIEMHAKTNYDKAVNDVIQMIFYRRETS